MPKEVEQDIEVEDALPMSLKLMNLSIDSIRDAYVSIVVAYNLRTQFNYDPERTTSTPRGHSRS